MYVCMSAAPVESCPARVGHPSCGPAVAWLDCHAKRKRSGSGPRRPDGASNVQMCGMRPSPSIGVSTRRRRSHRACGVGDITRGSSIQERVRCAYVRCSVEYVLVSSLVWRHPSECWSGQGSRSCLVALWRGAAASRQAVRHSSVQRFRVRCATQPALLRRHATIQSMQHLRGQASRHADPPRTLTPRTRGRRVASIVSRRSAVAADVQTRPRCS